MTARISRIGLSGISAALLSVMLPLVLSAQTQVTIEAGRDNTLYENETGSTSNGAGEHFFVGRTNQSSGSIRRGLVAFDVGTIPSNATVTSVTLTLNMSKTNAGSQTIAVHRVLADWGEGTSDAASNEGGGAPATSGDATWVHRFYNTVQWSAEGGDFSSTPSASLAVGAIGSYTWGSTAGLVSDVQQWVNNPSSNFGWVLIGNESSAGTSKRFDTKENSLQAIRPKITVVYTTTSGVEETTPLVFALQQNYPNPFNPATTISFDLGAGSRTTLKIFNLLGQEVATLVNAVLPAGTHSVRWDASGFSSGVYVYRLEAEGFVQARRLVLSR